MNSRWVICGVVCIYRQTERFLPETQARVWTACERLLTGAHAGRSETYCSDGKSKVARANLFERDHAAVDFRERPTQINCMKYRVMIEPDEDGVFVAECPALPGCVSQGSTRAEALANIKDAMTGYLASLKKHGEPVPPPISEEIVEIPA